MLGAVDIEASSHPDWSSWRRRLPPRKRFCLSVWRAGAAWTPTRRWSGQGRLTACPWCGFDRASARHFWADCPRFLQARRALEEGPLAVPQGWWGAQPRVTAKSAWVTYHADPSPRRRAQLQLAAAQLALQ
eukprot:6056830-Pyramimonas_sp.AAC.1